MQACTLSNMVITPATPAESCGEDKILSASVFVCACLHMYTSRHIAKVKCRPVGDAT